MLAHIKKISGFLGLALFLVAIAVIHHVLKVHRYHELSAQFMAFPRRPLFLAAGLTVLNYFVLTAYDGLAVRFIGRELQLWKITLTAFIAYVFSYNVGLSVFGGSAIRYRLYSAWDLSASEIAQIVAFNWATLWIGYLALAGFVFLFEPVAIQAHFALPFATVRPLGFICLTLAALYLIWSFLGKKKARIWKWDINLPSAKYAVVQIAISSFDWLLAADVLYVLMPRDFPFSFPEFLAVFLLAQLIGLTSHIPGGLGVFESVVLFFFSPEVPTSEIVTSLIIYRVIYYFLPLVAATLLLVGHELSRKKETLKKTADLFDKWVWGFIPQVMALSTFIGGAVLLFSGSTPAAAHRLIFLKDVLPLPVVEISHFLGSLVGAFLLFLAWGLHRRLNAAYFLTALMLSAGITFSLLKGADYEEAIILGAMLAALIPSGKYFYRKTSLLDEPLNWGWFTAVAGVLAFSVWLGFFAFKRVEYSDDLWWKFEFSAEASRFLRATVGAIIVALAVALYRLLKPPLIDESDVHSMDFSKIRSLLSGSDRTQANLALLGDKRFLFSDSGQSFLMYGVAGRSWVVMGDPVGPKDEWADLVWKFRELCDEHRGWPVFYEVGHEDLYLYVDLGLALNKIGEEARVSLPEFSLEGGARKDLRYTVNKNEKDGFSYRVVDVKDVPALLPALKQVSDRWLEEKKAREKGFSLGFFDETYLRNFPVVVVEKEGSIVAFANLWLTAQKEELSVDLMRYTADTSSSIMEYLLLKTILWGREQGYKWFSLGMAPLSGLQNHPLASLWNKIGGFVFRHGEDFYNFEGLRQYKEKFDPQWEPRYVASPAGLQMPLIFTNLANLISGGLKGALGK